MPHLRSRVTGVSEENVIQIPEVLSMGQFSASSIIAKLETLCATKVVPPSIERVDLPSLPSNKNERDEAIKKTGMICVSHKRVECHDVNACVDTTIDDTITAALKRESSSVFIYITTPPSYESADLVESNLYEMDDPYPSSLHTDLKRDLHLQRRQSDGNVDMQAGLPLFEKYKFLSPGKFPP